MFLSNDVVEKALVVCVGCADLAVYFTYHAQGFAVVDTMDTPDIKLFGKWSTDVSVSDSTLEVRPLDTHTLSLFLFCRAATCCAILLD